MVKLAKNSNRSEFTSKFSLELGSEFKLQFADRERSNAVNLKKGFSNLRELTACFACSQDKLKFEL